MTTQDYTRISERHRAHDEHLIAAIVEAVSRTVSTPHQCLSTDEQQWVKLAIVREAQSIKLRQAIIEKTLSGLAWAALLGLGVMIAEFAKNHGWKP